MHKELIQYLVLDRTCQQRCILQFKGSKVVERQNDHFSATMINHITWDTIIPEPFLEVDVKLNLSLEIYTRPFILLPTAAVERPGNMLR
ncbi:hypothetical protein CRYUN_Cryun02cG0078500 [Craigia yunnanensis]